MLVQCHHMRDRTATIDADAFGAESGIDAFAGRNALEHDIRHLRFERGAQAIDAATGDLLWEYKHPLPSRDQLHNHQGEHKRSLALYGNFVIFVSFDNIVIGLFLSLDVKTLGRQECVRAPTRLHMRMEGRLDQSDNHTAMSEPRRVFWKGIRDLKT